MSALPYYVDLPADRQLAARVALERELGLPLGESEADAVIEQVWNALVGHPTADEEAASQDAE